MYYILILWFRFKTSDAFDKETATVWVLHTADITWSDGTAKKTMDKWRAKEGIKSKTPKAVAIKDTAIQFRDGSAPFSAYLLQ